MQQKVNYQLVLDKTLEGLKKELQAPSLLLQCCCAPCSSYCLEYLSKYFRITAFYYNPNISPESEYRMRVAELKRLVNESDYVNPITVEEGEYTPQIFYDMSKGLEELPEGGERCFRCYELRLRETAKKAKQENYRFFTTTLSISPLKNAAKLNEIGAALAQEYDVQYLFSDFKKRNGYKRSIELSAQHGLYRQDYCGCIYSKMQREKQRDTCKDK